MSASNGALLSMLTKLLVRYPNRLWSPSDQAQRKSDGCEVVGAGGGEVGEEMSIFKSFQKPYLSDYEAAQYLGVDRGVLVTWPQKLGVRIYQLPGVKKKILKLAELEILNPSKVILAARKLKPYPGIQRVIAKMLRTPKWADPGAISAFYAAAKRISEVTGVKHHVDHVIPLQGKLVSGLHVPENLRIIPAIENRKKLNRYTP